MKICVAHARVARGDGSSRYIADVLHLLCEDGHEVALACDDVSVSLDPRVRCLATTTQERFEILLGSDLPLLQVLAPRAARLVYAPLGMLAWLEEPEREPELRALEAWALRACERLLRFTGSGVEVLEQEYGLALREKSCIGVFLSDVHPGAGPPPLSRPAPPTLLWVGRLTQNKNVTFLLEAAALLRHTDFRVEICGEGPARGELERLTRSLRLGDRVHLRGYVEDSALREAYARAALFLTASTAEQYSLTLMEAYAAGTPCIGLRPDMQTVFNGCNEQIEDGVTGLLIERPQDMASGIDRLLDDETLRQRMGHAGWRLRQALLSDGAFLHALRASIAAPTA